MYNWVDEFKNGRASTKRRNRSVCPVELTVEEVRKWLPKSTIRFWVIDESKCAKYLRFQTNSKVTKVWSSRRHLATLHFSIFNNPTLYFIGILPHIFTNLYPTPSRPSVAKVYALLSCALYEILGVREIWTRWMLSLLSEENNRIVWSVL